MKMVMPLKTTESGTLFYVKRSGAVIDAGSVIATLELDNPALVTKAQLYKGPFPELDVSHPISSQKLNHVHNSYKAILENTLAGKFLCHATIHVRLLIMQVIAFLIRIMYQDYVKLLKNSWQV